jgi:hypothetical protein
MEIEEFSLKREHWNQLFEYAACGAAIAFAAGGVGVVAVIIACGRLINTYWD